MLKFLTVGNEGYYFNPYNYNFYEIEPPSQETLNKYLSEDVFSFFKNYEYQVIRSLSTIVNLNSIYKNHHLFLSQLQGFENDLYDDSFLQNKYNHLNVLVLNVTEKCNLKCKYCFYVAENRLKRKHSSKSSNFNIIQRTIDFFIQRTNKIGKKPSICFYGGEPLIRFDLIKKSVDYVRNSLGNKVILTMTTNGTRLNDKIINYLIDHNVGIVFSLDGPAAIHNKNRIFKNGKGSFNIVYNNILKIYKKDIKYFRTNVGFSTVITTDTELESFFDFFNLNRSIFEQNIFKLALENTIGSIDRNVIYENQNFSRRMLSFYKEKLVNDDRSFNLFHLLFKRDLKSIVSREKNSDFLGRLCFPGQSRLIVDCDGTFYPCENLDHYPSIGNIENGFDFKTIREYVSFYIKLMRTYCLGCWSFPFCKLCYVHATGVNGFSEKMFVKSCEGFRNFLENILTLVIKCINEKGIDLLNDRLSVKRQGGNLWEIKN